MEANADAPKHDLHLLKLAAWGMESWVQGDRPEKNRCALEEQVNLLHGWKPANVTNWLLNNPNGPDQDKQDYSLLSVDESLLQAIERAFEMSVPPHAFEGDFVVLRPLLRIKLP